MGHSDLPIVFANSSLAQLISSTVIITKKLQPVLALVTRRLGWGLFAISLLGLDGLDNL
jgi:hypothetical protein